MAKELKNKKRILLTENLQVKRANMKERRIRDRKRREEVRRNKMG
jgi:hypothetical protein